MLILLDLISVLLKEHPAVASAIMLVLASHILAIRYPGTRRTMLEEINALFTHVIIEIVHTIILQIIPINFSMYAHIFFFLCVV